MDLMVLDFGKGADEVVGECLLKGEEKKIVIDSFAHNISMPLSQDMSNTKRTVGRAQFGELQVSKRFDSSSPKLAYFAATGKEFEKIFVRIYHADSVGDASTADFKLYLTYTMHNAMISNISVSGGGGQAGESMSLNFTKMEWEYKVQDEKSDMKGQVAYSYDLKSNVGGAA